MTASGNPTARIIYHDGKSVRQVQRLGQVIDQLDEHEGGQSIYHDHMYDPASD